MIDRRYTGMYSFSVNLFNDCHISHETLFSTVEHILTTKYTITCVLVTRSLISITDHLHVFQLIDDVMGRFDFSLLYPVWTPFRAEVLDLRYRGGVENQGGSLHWTFTVLWPIKTLQMIPVKSIITKCRESGSGNIIW